MLTKEDKFIFTGMIPTCAILAIIFILIAATAIHGPQHLTEQEVAHYTEVAEDIWNNKANHKSDTNLQYTLTDENITVYSSNIFKETVTLSFDNNTKSITVTEPHISFIGCTVFFSALGFLSIAGFIFFIITMIKEFKKTKITQKSRE